MGGAVEIDLHGLHAEGAIGRLVDEYNRRVETGYRGRLEIIHGSSRAGVRGSIVDRVHRLLRKHGIEFIHPYGGNPGRTVVRVGPGSGAIAPRRVEGAGPATVTPRPRGRTGSAPRRGGLD